MRNQLLQRKSADAELEQLKSVLDLAGRAGYKVLAARVISQGASTSFTQTITIDVGTSSGVRQNMTVVSGEGLVGVVKESYLNSALIMLATDPDFKVGVRIAGTQQIGILSGRGSKRADLQLLDNQKIVKVGDVLLARGSTNNRPFVPGIPVGIISAVDNTAGSIAQTATVMLYPNFSALGVVSVVLSAGKNNPGMPLFPLHHNQHLFQQLLFLRLQLQRRLRSSSEMLARQFSISSLIFLIIFLIQESFINQLRLPGGGFSLPLLIALTWAALSTPTVGALTGFISGFLMDLSQSSSGAMGHWTLLMILACYVVAFLGFGNDNVRGNPITNILLVSSASVLTLISFVITGFLLGVSFGSFSRVLITILGNGIWALFVTPLILPIVTRLHRTLFGNQAHI